VQGVGFRVFVARRAAVLALGGWVRNESGGAVRVVAEGGEAALLTLLRDLRDGPPGARVERVDEAWPQFVGEFERFEIRSGWHGGD
jgi:acylphosphatase